ncbi:MAG: glycosyltransferase family 2 protein [Thermodesulfovibrionales bacterium]|nr:glycosyltransferase family 2 protein [Thermodesulfovibrionales bacterium]
MIEFSIIIPVYNEEENVSELHRRLGTVMEKLGTYEIIFVDDGSSDRSWQIIKDLHERDAGVKGLSFSRNFGHHIAITAGLDHAKGKAIILMDGDLQDPPEEIPKLCRKLKEGYELVYGIRKEKKDSILKRFASFVFWRFINSFSGINIPRNQTLLRIFDRKILDALNSMRERSRFIHGMMAWTGFKTAVQEVEHAARKRGVSKYNAVKLFRLAFNAITSFSTLPLRVATYLGLLSAGVGMFYGFYFIYKKIFLGIPVLGYASIIVAVLFVGGIQLLILGIIGEYLGRVYQEVQARPIYVLREHVF